MADVGVVAGRRLRGLGAKLATRCAELAGTVAGRVQRVFPGAAGALLISWGLGEAWRPLLWITLGVFCLLVDWRRA